MRGLRQSAVERFFEKFAVDAESDCWLWHGCRDTAGYGQLRVNGRMEKAHRFFWIYKNGPVPEGLELDHLCRMTSCVNPDHLEPVTHRDNTLRGEAPSAYNARKTHCKHGHLFDEENTHYRPSGKRVCRACRRVGSERYEKRMKERSTA